MPIIFDYSKKGMKFNAAYKNKIIDVCNTCWLAINGIASLCAYK